MAKRSFYVKDSELDDYQVKVINKKTDNSYIVKGCAGSGKSILALWKAKQIQEQNKGSYLYVVYTKALKRYMSDGIKQVGLRESNVANYDACRFIEKTAPIHFTVGEEKMTLEADNRESQKAFFNWLEKDAPKIKDYFWKEWDTETTEKVNANLATYTSGYSAPRTTTAAAKEAVNAATTTTTKPVEPAAVSKPVEDDLPPDDMPDFTGEGTTQIPADETPVSTDDDDWINSVLNS